MAFKVITTAKRSGKGTLSREHSFDNDPVPADLRRIAEEASKEFVAMYGVGFTPIVDITVRRDDDRY